MVTGDPWGQTQSLPVLEPPMQESQSNVKFVQDTSKFWYKPHLPRLPRPRSLQPLANRCAISEEVPALLIALPNPSTAA